MPAAMQDRPPLVRFEVRAVESEMRLGRGPLSTPTSL